MKRSFLTLLIVLVLAFTTFLSTAYAVGKTAALLEFSFQESKGWVAVFSITGNWTEADLKGASITVDSKSLPLYCNFREDGRVACTAPPCCPTPASLPTCTSAVKGSAPPSQLNRLLPFSPIAAPKGKVS